MFQLILQYIQEWLRNPLWIAGTGIGVGFLLFLAGVIWKKPEDRKRGLLMIGLCVVAGLLIYFSLGEGD